MGRHARSIHLSHSEIRFCSKNRTDGGARLVGVHGVLWLLDRLETGRYVPNDRLHVWLTAISALPVAACPAADVGRRLTRYASKPRHIASALKPWTGGGSY